jgi:hypothetical protein
MKNRFYLIVFTLICAFTSLSSFTASAKADAANTEAAASMSKEQKEALLLQMKDRVSQIQHMDMSNLSVDQRKELRGELKAMKKEARQLDGAGIYISVGGLIIVILLLILILN